MLIINPHHHIWKRKRRWFKAAGVSAMGMLCPSEDTWRDGRHHEVLLLAGTSYGTTPSHGCFAAQACLDMDTFCCQGMNAPKARTPPLHPPVVFFWASHHEMGAAGRYSRGHLGTQVTSPYPICPSPSSQRWDYSLQLPEAEKNMTQIWFCTTAVRFSVVCRGNNERWNPCRQGFAKFCGKLVLQIIVSCSGDLTEVSRKAALFSNIHCSVPGHKSLSLA